MNTNYNKQSKFLSNTFKKLGFLFLCLASGLIYSQQSYTFTNASNTGSNGPTQAQVNTAYLSTNLAGSVTVVNGGVQTFTIPYTGGYRIEASGAAGGYQFYSPGYAGGNGAYVQGDFNFTAGQVLYIIVGQKGGDTQGVPADNAAPGGGGASFVYTLATSAFPLMAAGGGGGGGRDPGLVGATTGSNGNPAFVGGLGGSAGNGGMPNAGGSSYWAGAGAGWLTDGTGGNNATAYVYTGGSTGAYGGRRPANGAQGGIRYNDGTDEGGDGGFGGGGGGGSDNMGTGGGGGFSGGGGANSGGNGNPTGGGGGSYNSGTNQVNTPSVNPNHGKVVIRELCFISLASSFSVPLSPSICLGASLTLTTNAVTYTWSTGNSSNTTIVVTPTVTTTYSIVGTSTAICNAASYLTVTVSTGPPVMSITTSTNSICLGKTATLTATGALTYTWSNNITNGATYTPSVTNTYTVNGSNGCGTSSAVTTISVSPLPVSIVSNPTTVCAGGASTLTSVSAGTSFTWFPATGSASSLIVSPLVNTVYTLAVTDGTCSGNSTVALTAKPVPTITASPSATSVCAGVPFTFNATGAASYTWTPGNIVSASFTATPNVSTPYQVVGSNSLGCTAIANVVLIVNPTPTLSLSSDVSLICAGDPANLTVMGANSYLWSTSATTSIISVNPMSTAVYSVTGTTNSCSATETVMITVFIPTLSVTGPTAICNGDNATITASGANTYSWNNGFTSAAIQVNPNTTTMYTLTALTNSSGVSCPSTDSFQLVVLPNPTVTAIIAKPSICRYESTILTAFGASTYSWNWNTSTATTSTIVGTSSLVTTIDYTVVGVGANGCIATGTAQLKVTACTGLKENNASTSALQIYPNPSTSEFNIEYDTEINLNLINELGQLIRVLNLNAGNDYKIKVSGLSTGIYFIVNQSGTQNIERKIVITK